MKAHSLKSWVSEKSLEQLENQLQKQATYDTGPHWWEVSSLTTAPSLLPNKRDCRNEIAVRRGSSRWHYFFAIFWARLIVLTLTVSDQQMQLFAYPMSCIRAICLLFLSSFKKKKIHLFLLLPVLERKFFVCEGRPVDTASPSRVEVIKNGNGHFFFDSNVKYIRSHYGKSAIRRKKEK